MLGVAQEKQAWAPQGAPSIKEARPLAQTDPWAAGDSLPYQEDGQEKGRDLETFALSMSLFGEPLTEGASLVLAQEIVGGIQPGFGSPWDSQYSARATRVSTPSCPQGRIISCRASPKPGSPQPCLLWPGV